MTTNFACDKNRETKIRSGWKGLFQAKLVNWTLAILLLCEIAAILIGPLIIPTHWYLGWYLPDDSIKHAALFLNDQDEFMIFDDLTGWRNRPSVSFRNWTIDEHGSRSSHAFTFDKQKELRVLFHGSSMVNGSMYVNKDQTISSAIEDEQIEALNFGTMLFGLDQMYLDYRERLYKYNSDIIVLGLSEFPAEALVTRYVPFLRRQELNMPFMKPRFVIDGEQLQLLRVPSRESQTTLLTNDSLIKSLSETDSQYSNFAQFQRFGILPLSNMARALSVRFGNLTDLVYGDDDHIDLALTLMRKCVQEGEKHGAEVIFMILPERSTAFPSLWREYLPDHYGRLVGRMRAYGFSLVDGRQVLRDCGLAQDLLYSEDRHHYSPAANQVLGKYLKRVILNTLEGESRTSIRN